MDLIFFGMQGAGKGTVGKQVAKQLNLEIFETGGALRSLAQEDSPLGHKIKEIIEAGNLVPNEVVMEIVEDFMQKLPEGKSILFDGIPRSIEQAETLNALLDKAGRTYKAVLIKITEETALKRLTTRQICSKCKKVFAADYKSETCNAPDCGGELITRADDNPEAIKTRLNAFKTETQPAINTYKDNMVEIDGEPSIEEVTKLTIQTLQ
ncbi:adenylate kinase [Candidatus Peregrinibacteria bacterium]|jgi:adenylate kinase|nr:adenylate kinase [Candidatus Peregrinibacteria bacterium]MBT4147755.1 adenylate kinase [Candidatus Peregrinibacteria bacterium]MBT4365934.1 adenylate kinase [Candidatus Peregrinibacteria bacterium]MBT4456559.1 adenylate kinase [Candidatus Peregrinibacteria bacterium]